jgi:hypothetical protein
MPRAIQWTFSGEPWALWFKDEKICMNLQAKLHTATRGQAILDYWEKKGKFEQGSYLDVDWQATGQAMKAVSIARRHWVSKHSSGHCGTSKMMKRWHQRTSDLCPRCNTEVEDATHVWLCQEPRASTVWVQSINNLRVWLQNQKTDPGIINVLCAKLLAWQSGSTETISVANVDGLREVVLKQDEIGWQSLLEGRPALGWSEVQGRFLQRINSRKSGLRWLTALIQKLWDIAWDMWDNRNRVLHDTETSVARDLQIQQIRDQFGFGKAGLPTEVQALFNGGINVLLLRQPAYQAAWLIRIIAARARTERRNERQNETYSMERAGMLRWLGTSNT